MLLLSDRSNFVIWIDPCNKAGSAEGSLFDANAGDWWIDSVKE